MRFSCGKTPHDFLSLNPMTRYTSIMIAGILGALLLTFSCGKQAKIPQSEWETMIAIRAEAAAHYRAKTEHDFQLAIGETPADTAQLREMARHLFTRKNIDLLQRIEDSFQPGREETQVRRLRHYLIDGLIDLTLEPERRYAAEIASRPIELPDGGSISIQQIPRTLAAESNRDRREMLYNSQLPMLKRLNAVKQVELQRLDSLLMSLNYGSVTSYYQEVRDYDFAQLAVTAEEILDRTDSIAAAVMERAAPLMLGIDTNALRAYDVPRLLHSAEINEILTPQNIEALYDTLSSRCNFAPEPDSSVTVFWADNSHPIRRSSTFAVSTSDIRITITPGEGMAAQNSYWHEMGHALHYANTLQREFEFIYLGAVAEREMLAFLMEKVYLWNYFYQSNFEEIKGEDQLRRLVLVDRCLWSTSELLSVRAECADFLFEYKYFAGLEDARGEFVRQRERLHAYPVSDAESELYLSRVSLFESADYLMARIGAANLFHHLAGLDRVDTINPQPTLLAGLYDACRAIQSFLADSWQHGTDLSFDYYSEYLTGEVRDPDALISRLAFVCYWSAEDLTSAR